MRLCCLHGCFEVEDGNCCVCQKPCWSRSCKCTYMHKECATQMIQNYGSSCNICKHRFNTMFLQRAPLETESETLLIRQQNRIKNLQKRMNKQRLQNTMKACAHNIVKLYPYLQGARVVNHEIIMQDVMTSDRLCAALKQNLLEMDSKKTNQWTCFKI